jgi:hypothetical protein
VANYKLNMATGRSNNFLPAAHAQTSEGALREADRQTLSLALFPLVKQRAKYIMQDKAGGLSLSDWADLASAGIEKLLLLKKPAILRFEGTSEGALVNFIRSVLTSMLIDDQRRLTGRAPKKPGISKDSAAEQPDARTTAGVCHGEVGAGETEPPSPKTEAVLIARLGRSQTQPSTLYTALRFGQ